MGEIYQSKEYVFFNGQVITMDATKPQASVVKTKDGIITYVGTEKGTPDPLSGTETTYIDLKGRTLLPGFIDTHMHPGLYGASLLEIDCRAVTCDSIDKICDSVLKRAEETPNEQWLLGWGWDDSKLNERRNPTRWDLDKVSPHHPVILKRTCGHVAVVNSVALKLAGIDRDTPDPEGGHIVKDNETNEPNGILQERAMELVRVPSKTPHEMIHGISMAIDDFSRWGFTTVHDMSCGSMNMIAYQELNRDARLKVRLRPWYWALAQMDWEPSLDQLISLGIKSGFGDDMIKIQGVKLMLDGSVGGRTAAMKDPYEGQSDNRGIIFMPEEPFTVEAVKALKSGLRVAIHAIGERAIEICLNAIEAAAVDTPVDQMRNRIEHCAIPTDEQLARIKKLELVAGSSVGFVYWLGDSYIRNLGRERLKRVYPQKTFREWGIVAPANSDVPICDGNPMVGIYAAVTRRTMSGDVFDDVQNISVMDALKGYTIDAAFASFEEDRIGSITVGKASDLIVVSHDPLAIDHAALKDIEVELTMMNGTITYQK